MRSARHFCAASDWLASTNILISDGSEGMVRIGRKMPRSRARKIRMFNDMEQNREQRKKKKRKRKKDDHAPNLAASSR